MVVKYTVITTLVNTRIHQNALHNVQGVSERHGHFQTAIFGSFFREFTKKNWNTTQKIPFFLKKKFFEQFFSVRLVRIP